MELKLKKNIIINGNYFIKGENLGLNFWDYVVIYFKFLGIS